MDTNIYSTQAQQAAILAYQQLARLNLELHKPEVEEWLHSEASAPALKAMLEHVPCFGALH